MNIYFGYIVAKTRRKMVTINNITVARVPADYGKISLKQSYLS